MASIRVALAQLNFRVGDFETNVELISEAYERAVEQQADLVVYSELAVCGYPPEDLLLKQQFLDDARAAVDQIAARTSNAVAVVGFPELESDCLYNSAAICYQGSVKGIYRKQLLPNYSVFDEKRYFTPGASAGPIIEIAGVNIGVSICEDLWFDEGPIDDQVSSGIGLVISLNASPYQRGKDLDRASTVIERVTRHKIPVVYVNQVGGQDELIFDGSSFVADSRGQLVARLPQFEEMIHVVDLEVEDSDCGELPVIVASPSQEPKNLIPEMSVSKEEEETAEVWKALVLATRDYVNKNGFDEVVIGLSGGVDSSLVAAIAVDALGSGRVHGVSMPSRYSSQGSKDDAAELAKNFNIDFETIPIESGYSALTNMLEPVFEGHQSDLTEENLQSRIRGILLMAMSNKKGWLVLTTGNKSETSVGYSTLYGDTAGGFAVIKDCPKLLVYELCRWRNKQTSSAWIPEASITKPPSAELRPDQTDDQSLPPYEVLDPLLEAYVERDKTAGELISLGYDPEIVKRITGLVDLAEYKRRQSPPGPRISTKAFGKDRRLPITNRYR
ncbi:MAG: NAD synthetase [marine actinobacterium MedAcidi-G3]|nr:MAG: NAD synthetase [marine actinobacterium MedAcidi-G3]|tara:strand:+ start:472 stop:2148 length:1677 start_codon:yes stop_codon:yes gene_type:complete